MRKYPGKSSHGYWYTDYKGNLSYSSNLYGKTPKEFFQYNPYVVWWYVQCELDWYRMRKEYKELKNGDIDPVVA